MSTLNFIGDPIVCPEIPASCQEWLWISESLCSNPETSTVVIFDECAIEGLPSTGTLENSRVDIRLPLYHAV